MTDQPPDYDEVRERGWELFQVINPELQRLERHVMRNQRIRPGIGQARRLPPFTRTLVALGLLDRHLAPRVRELAASDDEEEADDARRAAEGR